MQDRNKRLTFAIALIQLVMTEIAKTLSPDYLKHSEEVFRKVQEEQLAKAAADKRKQAHSFHVVVRFNTQFMYLIALKLSEQQCAHHGMSKIEAEDRLRKDTEVFKEIVEVSVVPSFEAVHLKTTSDVPFVWDGKAVTGAKKEQQKRASTLERTIEGNIKRELKRRAKELTDGEVNGLMKGVIVDVTPTSDNRTELENTIREGEVMANDVAYYPQTQETEENVEAILDMLAEGKGQADELLSRLSTKTRRKIRKSGEEAAARQIRAEYLRNHGIVRDKKFYVVCVAPELRADCGGLGKSALAKVLAYGSKEEGFLGFPKSEVDIVNQESPWDSCDGKHCIFFDEFKTKDKAGKPINFKPTFISQLLQLTDPYERRPIRMHKRNYDITCIANVVIIVTMETIDELVNGLLGDTNVGMLYRRFTRVFEYRKKGGEAIVESYRFKIDPVTGENRRIESNTEKNNKWYIQKSDDILTAQEKTLGAVFV